MTCYINDFAEILNSDYYRILFTALNALHATWSSHGKAVCLSNAWIVTKQKKAMPRFLYHMKDYSI